MTASNELTRVVTLVAGALTELRDRSGFLIVELGDYYVQFGAGDGEGSVAFEAVSNEYLPNPSRLTENQIHEMLRLGFSQDQRAGNFRQTISIRTDADRRSAAETAVRILYGVFLCPEGAEPAIELHLD